MTELENKSDIYSKKAIWKRVLIVAALIFVGVSFFYSSRLVKKLSQEERVKVKLWANAISSRANTVNKTAKLFKELEDVERQKIELWARATEALASSASPNPDNNKFVLLAVDIIGGNHSIPIILTTEDGVISSSRNISGLIDTLSIPVSERQLAHEKNTLLLDSLLEVMKSQGNRIDINYIDDSYMYMYYKDSRILEELRTTFHKIQSNFVNDIISMAASTPVIYLQGDSVVAYNMVSSQKLSNKENLQATLNEMKAENEPIIVDLGGQELDYIYFSDSEILNTLKYYSVVQIFVMFLFILIGYWLFSIFRRSEQNNVWVGMAKETAHQLGTPLSSLMGWMDMLRLKKVDESIISEMEKDVARLSMITDRFSKIGAKPKLDRKSVYHSLEKFVTYFRTRVPRKVEINLVNNAHNITPTPINEPLFHWVIENLCKNGIDAMKGNGSITIEVSQTPDLTIIDVTDTGKGISNNLKTAVFQPGFTSKQRGWGLGLSLSKRIIKEYHNGKIYVKRSELGVGTTFRIELKQ